MVWQDKRCCASSPCEHARLYRNIRLWYSSARCFYLIYLQMPLSYIFHERYHPCSARHSSLYLQCFPPCCLLQLLLLLFLFHCYCCFITATSIKLLLLINHCEQDYFQVQLN